MCVMKWTSVCVLYMGLEHGARSGEGGVSMAVDVQSL